MWQDVRFGLRLMARNRGFAILAAITLALGIGGTTVAFSLLDSVLLHPLPYAHPDGLYRLFPLEGKNRRGVEQASYADFLDWQSQARTFEALAAYDGESLNLTGTAEPERLEGSAITPGFFATLGVSPSLGREFRNDDIVGIVGDVRQLGLDVSPDPELFMPYDQWPAEEMSLVLRITTEPSILIPAVKKQMWRVDPDQPVADVKTMDEWVAREAAGRRFILLLLGAFASIAAVLAAVGVYSVASHSTRQRTHEIGIRMALGARGPQVVWLILRQNLTPLLIGIAAGLAGAFALTRLLESYLYAVHPTDASTFVVILLVQSAIAGAAGLIPARRATRINPVEALRCE